MIKLNINAYTKEVLLEFFNIPFVLGGELYN